MDDKSRVGGAGWGLHADVVSGGGDGVRRIKGSYTPMPRHAANTSRYVVAMSSRHTSPYEVGCVTKLCVMGLLVGHVTSWSWMRVIHHLAFVVSSYVMALVCHTIS